MANDLARARVPTTRSNPNCLILLHLVRELFVDPVEGCLPSQVDQVLRADRTVPVVLRPLLELLPSNLVGQRGLLSCVEHPDVPALPREVQLRLPLARRPHRDAPHDGGRQAGGLVVLSPARRVDGQDGLRGLLAVGLVDKWRRLLLLLLLGGGRRISNSVGGDSGLPRSRGDGWVLALLARAGGARSAALLRRPILGRTLGGVLLLFLLDDAPGRARLKGTGAGGATSTVPSRRRQVRQRV